MTASPPGGGSSHPASVAMETGPRGPVTGTQVLHEIGRAAGVAMETGPRGPVTVSIGCRATLLGNPSQWRPAREGR